MVKNKLTQIIFRTIYLVLGVIGILGSFGYFGCSFNGEFYVYYTNLSNYICIAFIAISLVQTIKSFKKEQYGYTTANPTFKFVSMIMIIVTCLVYNILLAKDYSVGDYFLSISNLTNHLILPIMFVLDWILFYEHNKVRWYYPLLSVVMPLIYVVFVLIRALILGASYTGTLYPYFFLNVANLGWGGVIGWIFALVAVFVALGYIIYLLDHLGRFKKKKD